MRMPFPATVEHARIREPSDIYATKTGDLFGAFLFRNPFQPDNGDALRVVANNASRDSFWWEHVSVSTATRCPTWPEMCFIKDLFWHEDECVVQYHPALKDYVNHHPYTLHLWRPTKQSDRMPTPPSILVGPKR